MWQLWSLRHRRPTARTDLARGRRREPPTPATSTDPSSRTTVGNPGHRHEPQRRQGHPELRRHHGGRRRPGELVAAGRGERDLGCRQQGRASGDLRDGPTLGVTGAIAGDTNTAVQLDGVNDSVASLAHGNQRLLGRAVVRVDAGHRHAGVLDLGRAGWSSGRPTGSADDFGVLGCASARPDRGRDRRHLDRLEQRRPSTTEAGTSRVHPVRRALRVGCTSTVPCRRTTGLDRSPTPRQRDRPRPDQTGRTTTCRVRSTRSPSYNAAYQRGHR